MRNDKIYLRYIEESIEKIESYLNNMIDDRWRDIFRSNQMIQDAVLRRIETLSDATSKLSPELKSRHPFIRWRDITDFRNILAHAYMEIDIDIVWDVLTKSLPMLRASVQAERNTMGDGTDDRERPTDRPT